MEKNSYSVLHSKSLPRHFIWKTSKLTLQHFEVLVRGGEVRFKKHLDFVGGKGNS